MLVSKTFKLDNNVLDVENLYTFNDPLCVILMIGEMKFQLFLSKKYVTILEDPEIFLLLPQIKTYKIGT